MPTLQKYILTTLIMLVLSSCATAPRLTEGGAKVRKVTQKQAEKCAFIRTVQYQDRILSLGKEPLIMRSIGLNNIRNKVSAVRGNAYVLTRKESNFFMGSIFYEADAYKCSFKP